MVKNRLLYGIALLSALLFYVFYYVRTSELIFLAVLLLPVLSLLVSLPSMLRCRQLLSRRDFVRQGEPASVVVLSLPNRFFPSAHLRCRLELVDLTYGATKSVRVQLCGHQKQTLPLASDHCRCVEARVKRLRIYDYLGLFWLPLRKSLPTRTVILPRPTPIRPKPDLSNLQHRSYRPKNGGFAEVHEIRPFREGDNLRDVHWKLSAKVDDLMLREAMQPEDSLVLIALTLCQEPAENDGALGRLVWLGERLLEEEIPFSIRFFHPETGEIQTAAIASADALQDFLVGLLQLRWQVTPLDAVPCADADTVFVVRAQSEVEHEG